MIHLRHAVPLVFAAASVAGALQAAETHSVKMETPPLSETGECFPDLASFDDLMRSFLKEHQIPGAALAVAREGRVVYARGFGYADPQTQQPVQPDSLFRIASVSKPITAVAVLRLVDQGKLSLDDAVLDLLPQHEAHLPAGREQDPRLRDMTIRHLLQHTGGWDRDISIDPMFHSLEIASALGTPPPATPDDIVQFMLGWPLDFAPGDRHAYSNFGYCLLGRVIEQVSGMRYEQHVREQLLAPLGITTMQVGQTLESQRAPGEVWYDLPRDRFAFGVTGDQLGRRVPRPYGAWSLEAMDSHGGWIASAIDVVRFGSAVDSWEDSHLLSAESIAAMVTRPEGSAGHEEDGSGKPVYYGLGWMVRHVDDEGGLNLWHNGRFDGASSLLVLRHDGLCWAALFNTSATADGKSPAGKLDSLLHRAADAVTRWPDHDLANDD